MNVSQHPLDDKLLLGRYRVVRLLGEGGMGTVHLAERVDGEVSQRVAVKLDVASGR